VTLSLHRHRDLIVEIDLCPITPSVVASVRKRVGHEAATTLLEIASVQSKAIKKFGPGVWMTTSRAIEQASDRVVADHKASWMPDRSIIDLCGGIGGDAMAFARRGRVITIDRDLRLTAMASENMRSVDAKHAAAICCDATGYLTPSIFAGQQFGVHIDPDRRPGNRRTTAPDAYEPSLDFVLSIMQKSAATIVKFAPAAELNPVYCKVMHRSWISFAGSVREQTLLAGECLEIANLRAGTRSAVKLFRDARPQSFVANAIESDFELTIATEPMRYVIDIDPAVRAAGLSVTFAVQNGLQCLGEPSGFFTTDSLPIERSMMQCFEILWSGPIDLKQIRRHCTQASLLVRTVKVRGTDHDPVAVSKFLNAKQMVTSDEATLLLGRSGKKIYAAVGRLVEGQFQG